MNRQFPIRTILALFVISAGIFLMSCKPSSDPPKEDLQKLTIAAINPSFTGYTIYVALDKGYFKAEGLDVVLESYPHGNATLKALMDGKVDLATASETPFMHAVLNGGKICILASMITGEKHLGVVGRRDRGIASAKDLKGKRIGVTRGTNGEYFLDTVLLLNKISRDEIHTVNIKPKRMFEALMNGEVDAIATWNPQNTKAQKALGEGGITFDAQGLYSPSFVMVAQRDYQADHPEIVRRVLKALVNASQFIQQDPGASQAIVAQHLGIKKDLLDELSSTYRFKITLDQPLLSALEAQCQWAIQNGLTQAKEVPNFLEFICTDALESVKPDGVLIIR
jgi:ABC-type nitrate/sulfonate/bicarbonate transport system substrate-binding protein